MTLDLDPDRIRVNKIKCRKRFSLFGYSPTTLFFGYVRQEGIKRVRIKREREINEVTFLQVYLGDSIRQPQPSRENLE